MKTYTVSLFDIINAVSPTPRGVVSQGIAITKYGESEIPQVHVGVPTRGCNFEFCEISAKDSPALDGNLLMAGYPIQINRGETKRTMFVSAHRETNSLLVRIFTRTQRNLDLTISEIVGGPDDGVKPIVLGSGIENDGTKYHDGIFIIKPHCAIAIEKDGKPYMAIVNTGGNIEKKSGKASPQIAVMSWQEYLDNYMPHLLCTPRVHMTNQEGISVTTTAPNEPPKTVRVRADVMDDLGEFDNPAPIRK